MESGDAEHGVVADLPVLLRPSGREQVGEFCSGGDAELGERAVEVVADGAWAQEQVRGDFAVGGAGGREADDFALLGAQASQGESVASDGSWVSPAAWSSVRARWAQGRAFS